MKMKTAGILRICFPVVAIFLFSHCNSGGSGGATASCLAAQGPSCSGYGASGLTSLAASGSSSDNILPIAVGNNTSLCGANVNIPCTTVTVCAPGSTTNCQSISDILVDTGSYGLRIFNQALLPVVKSGFTQVTDGGMNPVAECATFGIGSDWGPVMTADVQLGTEPVISSLPIQVIDSTFSTRPSQCASSDVSPSQAGFNGILGVGLLDYDCGASCVGSASPDIFFSCAAGTCTSTALALNSQVKSAVAAMGIDNNGVVIDFSSASVASGGTGGVCGTLTLGIGTRANNSVAAGTTAYPAQDPQHFPYIESNFPSGSGTTDQGFLDTGSNGFYFTDNSIGTCGVGTSAPGFFCPGGEVDLSVTNSAGVGPSAVSGTVDLAIQNANNLVSSCNNRVYSDIGAPTSLNGTFDFGFPFFIGKKVYLVNEGGSAASLGGNGPTWGY